MTKCNTYWATSIHLNIHLKTNDIVDILGEYTKSILNIVDDTVHCSKCNKCFPLSQSLLSSHMLSHHLPSTHITHLVFPAPAYRCCLCGIKAGPTCQTAKHAHLIQQHPLALEAMISPGEHTLYTMWTK